MINKRDLETHFDKNHKKIICNYCIANFKISNKEFHLEICEKKPKKCLFCQLNYSINLFNDHFEMCSSRTKSCIYCQKYISNKNYIKHEKVCLLELSRKVNCKNCKKSFKKTKDYKEGKDFKCKKCLIPHKIITKKILIRSFVINV